MSRTVTLLPGDGIGPEVTAANPLALMRSAVLMLRHLEMPESERLAGALRQVVVTDGIRTGDLGGKASTQEFTDAVVRVLESGE